MMYKIIEHDGKLHWPIDEKNKANPYGKPKAFRTYEEAEKYREELYNKLKVYGYKKRLEIVKNT